MMTCFKHTLLIIASHFQKQTYQCVIADQLLNREEGDSYQDSESKQSQAIVFVVVKPESRGVFF